MYSRKQSLRFASIIVMLSAFTRSEADSFARPGLPFIANAGQHDNRILFHSNAMSGQVYITHAGTIAYTLPAVAATSGAVGVALEEHFVGGTIGTIRGVERSPVSVSFFRNADPRHWQADVPSFERVSLGFVYEGIECTLRAGINNVEKIFIVAPGAAPENIRLHVDGAIGFSVDATGRLEVHTELGSAKFTKPIAYQTKEGEQRMVEVAYTVDGLEYGFTLGSYDHSRPLIIDPLLAATYIGGSGLEGHNFSGSICLGPDGSVYIANVTESADLPIVPGAYDDTYGGNMDVFIARFTPDLTQLLAATYLGGVELDGYDRTSPRLLVDAEGRVYVTGQTKSSDFPTTAGAYDREYNGGYDIFISCLNADLTELLYSTFIGSPGDDWSTALRLTTGGDVVVAGHVRASGYPTTPGAYSSQFKGYNGWYFGGDTVISRLSGDLSTLIASTYLGGTGYEFDTNLSIASDGTFYLSGTTSSRDFPITPEAFNPTHATAVVGHEGDIFVAHVSADLTTLLASTYLGGGRDDWSNSILAAPDGTVYVGGHTCTLSFPVTPGAYDTTFNGPTGIDIGNDAIVSRFDANLTTLLASTYIGGYEWEMAIDVVLDEDGYLYVGGHGRRSEMGENFPTTPGAFATVHSGTGNGTWIGDGYISRLDADLATMSASTFFGGSGADAITDILLDPDGNVYFTGYSNSDDLPMAANGYDPTYNGGTDAYVAKLDKMLCACMGDLNGDGVINLRDLAQLLGHYGAVRAAYAQGDLNGDGTIDMSDLAHMLSVYGDDCR